MLDLLITGGLVIDGSGNPGTTGRSGSRASGSGCSAGDLDGVQAHRTLDAAGRVVCPGFIDMHAHSGLVILAEPRHEPKVRQGVTTEVIGIDGCSYAPFPTAEDLEAFVEINAGLDGCPPLPGPLDDGRAVPRPLHEPGGGQHRVPRRELPAPRVRRRLGGPRRASRPSSRISGPSSARRWRRAPGACRPGSTTRRGATPTPTSSWRCPRRRAGSAASTTPTCATAWAIASSIPSGRRSRSGAGPTSPRTSRTSTSGRRRPAARREMLGPGGGRARGGARRHLRRLSLRLQLDAAEHRDPAVGVRRRPRPRCGGTSPIPRRAPG